MLSTNANKIVNDVQFQVTNQPSREYAISAPVALRLGISFADLKKAAKELVAAKLAVTFGTDSIKKV